MSDCYVFITPKLELHSLCTALYLPDVPESIRKYTLLKKDRLAETAYLEDEALPGLPVRRVIGMCYDMSKCESLREDAKGLLQGLLLKAIEDYGYRFYLIEGDGTDDVRVVKDTTPEWIHEALKVAVLDWRSRLLGLAPKLLSEYL